MKFRLVEKLIEDFKDEYSRGYHYNKHGIVFKRERGYQSPHGDERLSGALSPEEKLEFEKLDLPGELQYERDGNMFVQNSLRYARSPYDNSAVSSGRPEIYGYVAQDDSGVLWNAQTGEYAVFSLEGNKTLTRTFSEHEPLLQSYYKMSEEQFYSRLEKPFTPKNKFKTELPGVVNPWVANWRAQVNLKLEIEQTSLEILPIEQKVKNLLNLLVNTPADAPASQSASSKSKKKKKQKSVDAQRKGRAIDIAVSKSKIHELETKIEAKKAKLAELQAEDPGFDYFRKKGLLEFRDQMARGRVSLK